jgi:hypothetical protein
MTDESNCYYVCSRGLLKKCHVHNRHIRSSVFYLDIDLSKGFEGCTLYVCTKSLPLLHHYINQIPYRFILLSGDADEECGPSLFPQFLELLESPKIIRWFAQNLNYKHSKISHLPIGLDYHTLAESTNHAWGSRQTPLEQERILLKLRASSNPFYERQLKCYTTFHFCLDRGDREEAYRVLDCSLVDYEPEPVDRLTSWEKQVEYAFVVSPEGNGKDCHRTWEALALGCIPIVKSSFLNPLFEQLPVLIVNEWSEVTEELLERTVESFRNQNFDYQRLTLRYWMEKIHN